jgi:L-ascorbate metabolism protein UlaG (beta-lactamase superfamily)
VAPGIHWDEVPEVDAVLISHNHYDHMDWPTLKRLPRSTPLFVPLGMEAWAKKRGFTEVHAPDWWQSTPHRGLELTFVPSHHWSRRGLADTNDSLWGGWLIAGGGRTIHFAGDTAYGPHFADIARRFPRIDATLMPIGGYEPRWFMRPVHMDPEDAVQGALDLRAQRLVTMHHATFPLTTEPILEPIERARTAWQRTGLARQRLWDLAVGETRSFA